MIFLLILSLFISQGLQAQIAAHPQTRLQKLSKALQLKNASAADLNHIGKLREESEIRNFLKSKSAEYMKSPAFQKKMQYKIEELFHMRVSSSEIPSQARNQSFDFDPNSSFDFLVKDLILKNQSWDQLLLAHEFKIKKVDTPFSRSEFEYFEVLLNQATQVISDSLVELKKISQKALSGKSYYMPNQETTEIVTYQFDVQDPRVAGVLATPRFFRRYGNTALNKNRKRAAAIFRIFLCDSMVPAVPVSSEDLNQQDLDFLNDQELTEQQILEHTKVDLHGEQPDCRKCHDKLDPVGRVFSSSNFTLGPVVAKGSLYIPRTDSKPFKKEVLGPRGLAKEIVQTPEYLKCQTEHFWRWFIGEDVPLLANQHKQLVDEFEKVGRRPLDFIQYLTTLPQFNQAPRALTEDQVLSRKAVKVLKTCHSCHSQNPSEIINYWDLTEFPYGPNETSRQWALDSLKEVIDYKNGSELPTMPPKSSQWRPTRSEYDLLIKWIDRGAPDLNGHPQVGIK